MRKLFVVLLLVSATAARAQNVAGDWNGAIDTGAAKLHLVLHIVKSATGALTATLDSVDQNAIGIPVKSVTVDGTKLSLDIAAVGGKYEGTVNGDTISGTWTQGAALPLTFTRSQTKVVPSDIDGAWSGTLGGKLRLVFHVINTATGLRASIDSIDQGANGIPVATVTRNGSSIRFDVAIVGASYVATISKDLDEMSGTWSQNGADGPLMLHRVKNAAELEPRRPQQPKPPFPYDVRDVTFGTLAGTLTMPRGSGPFPAAVLIAGSGPHDRDEALMGHKPFLVLADSLTRHGIAVLRFDKRGIGKSGGDFATATTDDFANDAEAAFTFAKGVAGIDPHRVGLIGHSEGAVIAPIVAARRSDVAYVVMMAGSGVTGDRILIEQMQLIAAADGASADEVKRGAATETEVVNLIKSNDPKMAEKLRAKLKGTMPDAAIEPAIGQMTSPWMRAFVALDPTVALRKVKCPLLAIAGSKDLQVPPEENIAAIRAADPHAETRIFPGLNHLFQHATSGSPSEYARIEETMAPEVLEAVAKWINATTLMRQQ
jgi:pimeloyl-ACP methyl ester carboxylesterase